MNTAKNRERAIVALQRRTQQPPVQVIHARPVSEPRRLPTLDLDVLALAAVFITALISLTILGSLFGLRGIIYEMRRNPDVSTCLVNCND